MLNMWFLFIGIATLSFSAFFGAYLAVFYTPSFKVASFAKATSVALFFIGIIILFVTVGWWGFSGIIGYYLFFALSMAFWHKRFEAHLKADTDPWATFESSKKIKKDDQHLVILIQLLLDKNSGKKLLEWLAEYYLANSDKLTEMYQHHVCKTGSIRKDEREMYINETIGIDFKKELLDGAKYSNHRGQFQSEPVYTSIYSQNNDPIAVSATFSEMDSFSRRLNQLSVPVTKKKALVSKIISNLIGKPKMIDEDEGLFFWKSDDNVSVLLFPLGHCESRLILFIFDHSKIEKNIMENALKDIGME